MNSIFGKLDTNKPEDIAEMEKLLKEKYEASKKKDTKEYIVDDRIVIPEAIKRMSASELDEAIEKLEKEIRDKKQSQ